jgi:hypothetical protein
VEISHLIYNALKASGRKKYIVMKNIGKSSHIYTLCAITQKRMLEMSLLFFGQTTTPIGVEKVLCRCSVCEQDTWSDLMVQSVYTHIYYIPVFPVDKLANLICQECGNKRYGVAFDSKLISNYEEIKSKFKHPLRTYLLSGTVGLLILIALIVSNFS